MPILSTDELRALIPKFWTDPEDRETIPEEELLNLVSYRQYSEMAAEHPITSPAQVRREEEERDEERCLIFHIEHACPACERKLVTTLNALEGPFLQELEDDTLSPESRRLIERRMLPHMTMTARCVDCRVIFEFPLALYPDDGERAAMAA